MTLSSKLNFIYSFIPLFCLQKLYDFKHSNLEKKKKKKKKKKGKKLHTVVWFQVFQFRKEKEKKLHTVVWFQVFKFRKKGKEITHSCMGSGILI